MHKFQKSLLSTVNLAHIIAAVSSGGIKVGYPMEERATRSNKLFMPEQQKAKLIEQGIGARN